MLARFYKSVSEWPHWAIGRSPQRCVDWVPFRVLVYPSGISKHPATTHTQGMHMTKIACRASGHCFSRLPLSRRALLNSHGCHERHMFVPERHHTGISLCAGSAHAGAKYMCGSLRAMCRRHRRREGMVVGNETTECWHYGASEKRGDTESRLPRFSLDVRRSKHATNHACDPAEILNPLILRNRVFVPIGTKRGF